MGPSVVPNGFSNHSSAEYASRFVIGVAGGTASGKTTVCDYIMQRLHEQRVVILSQDSFYRGLTQEELLTVQGEGHTNCNNAHTLNTLDYNFDDPSSLDIPAIVNCLRNIKVDPVL